jgi:DNA-binding XRE family transcriptional regulator
LSSQTTITAEKGYKFLSDSWIALKLLQYFGDAVILVVPMESLLDEDEVLSRQTEITAEKGYNF